MTAPQREKKEDEFYVGYGKIPKGFRNFLLAFVPPIVIGFLAFAIVLPAIFNQFNPGGFAGSEMEGWLVAEPVPHIAVLRPGNTSSEGGAYSRYLLSDFIKFGPRPNVLAQAGKWVQLKGGAVFRNGMVLVNTRSAEPIEQPPNLPALSTGDRIGEVSLDGEILDSKCYLGVMKPGSSKTHRGCAIRCISGGIPPIFKARNLEGDPAYFVLVDAEGKMANERILPWVADPVRIRGEVVRYDDLFVLEADPDTYELAG